MSNFAAKIPGYATPEGTLAYKNFGLAEKEVHYQHFRKPYQDDLNLSSTGIGTYLGAPTNVEDLNIFIAIIRSVRSGGFNVIDTAINYRFMKSERVVGAAISKLISHYKFTREQLFISSKIGYIPVDGDRGIDTEMYIKDLIKNGIVTESDVIGGVHCMTPKYLNHQLNTSLENLNLETLDLMYLHNSAESQMPIIGEKDYY